MNPHAKIQRQIRDALDAASRVVVLGHIRPDGDAIGSQLALGIALRATGKDVAVWNEDGLPGRYAFLPGADMIARPPDTPERFDLAFALDTATRARLGNTLPAVAGEPVWINVDHHVSNERYGDLLLIDPDAPATGEILHDLLPALGLEISPEVAACLFVAIATDTGSFQFPSTTARTFEIAADLVRAGADVGRLSREINENHPRRRLELLRHLLATMSFHDGERVACWSLAREDSDRIAATAEDHEGLIDVLRSVKGVVVAAIFEELPDGKTRVSLRSKDPSVNVSQIAAQFGGGGHILAAGARIPRPLAEVQPQVLAAIHHAIQRLD